MTRSDGKLIYSTGASRSGKTQYVLSQIVNDKRILVWDAEGEYSARLSENMGFITISNQRNLVSLLETSIDNKRIAYLPHNLKEFDFFCRCAFNWSRQSPATIVCEELANATNPAKAAGWWGILVSRGLKYGTTIYGIIQRAQEGDKSSLGNATVVNICRPNNRDDALYVSKKFNLNLSDIPDTDLQMLERHKDRTVRKVQIIFKNNLPILENISKFDKNW